MGSKMLIDASQAEEIRVVLARGNKLEEFDFESISRKPLKGNIYLAKVTRVEPSLQAAFVEYGGNRHGFLAFAEIHPDYYQIPIADRMALIAEQEAEEAEDEAEDEAEEAAQAQAQGGGAEPQAEDDAPGEGDAMPMLAEHAHDEQIVSEPMSDSEPLSNNGETAPESSHAGEIQEVEHDGEVHKIETIGEEDALEEVPQRRERRSRPRKRHYKIQEVIKRRQILLVQVIKEERGNKGAALTTYLSLAGRYCVLMPNTARGGGISRKITDAGDRRRLKEVAKDVEVPKGMGVIVRTAGAQRTRPEIKRDFDYLMRLWESVRELTLKSQAPSLVYEEGNLIKRSIRDLYTKDVDEIFVDGEGAYKEARDFMKMLMPSHTKNVKQYIDGKPIFQRHGLETAIDALYSPTVNLPSGGYIVINQTEALVSIDINSGRATREHNIEDTATKTNLEACDEIARQLRLRDLAGLVVIDFIDMEENRNNRAVERRMKDALKNDRARIQVGRISHFGLLEMSRQRLRPGLLEGSFKTCPHCEGRGIVRSIPSCGLGVLRQIEEYLQKGKAENLTVKAPREVAFYLLNDKRDSLLEIEQQYGISIFLVPGDDVKGSMAVIERAPEREKIKRRSLAGTPVQMETAFNNEPEVVEEEFADEEAADEATSEEGNGEQQADANGEQRRENGRRRRRRGRRGGRRDDAPMNGAEAQASGEFEQNDSEAEAPADDFVESAEAASNVEQVDDDAPAQAEGDAAAQEGQERGERGQRRGRKRGRFGRERGPREDRAPREERAPRAEGEAEPPRERAHRAPRAEREFVAAPVAAPVIINIPDVIAEPEPRKWTPPAPTVVAEPAQRKGGWWSKK